MAGVYPASEERSRSGIQWIATLLVTGAALSRPCSAQPAQPIS